MKKKLFCEKHKKLDLPPPLIHNCVICRTCPICWMNSGMSTNLLVEDKERKLCNEHQNNFDKNILTFKGE